VCVCVYVCMCVCVCVRVCVNFLLAMPTSGSNMGLCNHKTSVKAGKLPATSMLMAIICTL